MKLILSVDTIKFPLTGIGRYTLELAKRLERSSEISDLHFISGGRLLSTLPAEGNGPGGKYVLKRLVQDSRIATDVYRLLMPLLQRRALKGLDNFIYHSPSFFIPPFSGCSIATFHDLSPFTWAHCHTVSRVRLMQKELKNTLTRADFLITDSEYTRREVAEYFSWPIERIHTIPLASSDEFFPRNYEALQQPLAQFDLVPGGYSLFAGTIEPRKNIDTLLDAYSRLPITLRKKWPLVIVGYRGWCSESIHERIATAQNEGWVRYLGFLPAVDLPLIFSGARLFVFPSFYEGFGLPVLEAMSSGVPVISSNSSSLPETAGGAAALFDPQDVEHLTVLLTQGLSDEVWRAKARDLGLSNAARYSWDKCATKTLDIYKAAIGVA